jgi:hypothetical protein
MIARMDIAAPRSFIEAIFWGHFSKFNRGTDSLSLFFFPMKQPSTNRETVSWCLYDSDIEGGRGIRSSGATYGAPRVPP